MFVIYFLILLKLNLFLDFTSLFIFLLLLITYIQFHNNLGGTKWPFMYWCAVKKLLTHLLQGGAKNGAILSHCKYSEIPWPNCVEIAELLQYYFGHGISEYLRHPAYSVLYTLSLCCSSNRHVISDVRIYRYIASISFICWKQSARKIYRLLCFIETLLGDSVGVILVTRHPSRSEKIERNH